MKRTLASLSLALFIGAVSNLAQAGLLLPISASSDAIKGKIVDRVTGKPLAGVLVVATWHSFTPDVLGVPLLHQGGGAHYSCYQLVNVVTAMTDADGDYELPAWSGKSSGCRYMSYDQPYVIWYKPGYGSLGGPPDFLIYHDTDSGPEHTDGSHYGGTASLKPLGPHMFVMEDNHFTNLSEFGNSLGNAFEQDQKAACFWSQERPAWLVLMQEVRRLSKYMSDEQIGFYRQFLEGRSCGDAAAVAALTQQADATVPEEPILPYVRPMRPRGGEASSEPEVLQDYVREEQTSDHAADAKAIVYHVYVNPANPYFLAMVEVSAFTGNAPGQGLLDATDANAQSGQGVFGYVCPGVAYMPSQYPQQRGGAAQACWWTVALTNGQLNRDVYHADIGAWTLTGRSFVRGRAETLPGVVEIHAPAPFSVSTTLASAGPQRWQLPPPGQPFDLSITMAAGAGNPDDACAHMLPDSLNLQLTRQYQFSRLMRLSEAPRHVTACPDVVVGDFQGKGEMDYAFHLMGPTIHGLLVAVPDGTAWRLAPMQVRGCEVLFTCGVVPASAGSYTKPADKPAFQWTASPSTASDTAGAISFDAPHPGFIETGGQVSYAYFYVDGEWRSIIAVPPAATTVH